MQQSHNGKSAIITGISCVFMHYATCPLVFYQDMNLINKILEFWFRIWIRPAILYPGQNKWMDTNITATNFRSLKLLNQIEWMNKNKSEHPKFINCEKMDISSYQTNRGISWLPVWYSQLAWLPIQTNLKQLGQR